LTAGFGREKRPFAYAYLRVPLRHLVSKELAGLDREARPRPGAALLVQGAVGVMVNEEDHLRLHGMRSGFALEEAYADLEALDGGADKTREIGILLAMGLKQRSIRRIFLAQGILVGLIGTSLGVGLGLVVGGMVNRGHWIPIDPSIYFIDHLPVRMQALDALSVIAASLLVAMLAPLYPAVQASRLDPVTAIRYE
jgi:hypothetical protein